jgi:hypothetical protein
MADMSTGMMMGVVLILVLVLILLLFGVLAWRQSGGLNLTALDPAHRVQVISYRRGSYLVTTADGETHTFGERNLRLIINSSESGPPSAAPALVNVGMMEDRADVIFAAFEEIRCFVKQEADGAVY